MNAQVKSVSIAVFLVAAAVYYGAVSLEEAGLMSRLVTIPGPIDMVDAVACAAFAYVLFVVAVATVVAIVQKHEEVRDLAAGRALCMFFSLSALVGGLAAFGYGMLFVPHGSWEAQSGIIGGVTAMAVGVVLIFVERKLDARMSAELRYRYR
jgi:hypothetical protein